MTTASLMLHCQTLRARPRVRALLLARLERGLQALEQQGFQPVAGALDSFVQQDPGHGYPVCGYSRSFVDPADGSRLELRCGLQLGDPDQASFLCGFVLQVLRPDTVAIDDIIGRVLNSESERRILCEVSSSCSPGAAGWDTRGGVDEVERLLTERGLFEPDARMGSFDAEQLARKAVRTLQP